MLDSAINKRTFTMVLWRCPVLSGAGQPDPSLLMYAMPMSVVLNRKYKPLSLHLDNANTRVIHYVLQVLAE